MDKRRFNRGKKGNKGGGRASKREEQEHLWAWRGRKEMPSEEAKKLALEVLGELGDGNVEVDYRVDLQDISERVKLTGRCSGWEAFLLEAVGKRNPMLLGKWADKVLADLHEHQGAGGEHLFPFPTSEQVDRIRDFLKKK